MRVDILEKIEDFEKIHENWNRIYLDDPESQLFLSWDWLHGYLSHRRRWFILALKHEDGDADYSAFLPLKLATYQDEKTKLFCDEILMAGNYGADYTGFLCMPGLEDDAADAFADFIAGENWTNLKFDYFCTASARLERLLRAFPDAQFIREDRSASNHDDIDDCICPYVTLPESWEDYLGQHLSAQTCQKLKRLMRIIETSPDHRITHATQETIDRDLDILFRFWHAKWAARKGNRIDQLIRNTREMLRDCFDGGGLDVRVLWHRERPLGVLANLVDHQKKAILFYISGRDEEWTTPSPGLVLHGFAIRDAIERGFRTYDFLHGNEPYKYSFGVEERRVHRMLVRTRTGQNLRNCLNRRSIDFVFDRATSLHMEGKFDEAEAGYRQVIRTLPQHIPARYCLAQLCDDKGEHAEAEHLYRGLLAVMPNAGKIQHCLGDSQIAQALYHDAIETFEGLLARHPYLSVVRYKLAVALLATGQRKAAIDMFRSLEDIASDEPDHIRCKLKAEQAVLRLRATAFAQEPKAERRMVQAPISFAPTRQQIDLRRTALAPSVRQPKGPPLLKPSLPAGISAHLQASPRKCNDSGSKSRH